MKRKWKGIKGAQGSFLDGIEPQPGAQVGGYPPGGGPGFVRGSETSMGAALRICPRVGSLQRMCLDLIRAKPRNVYELMAALTSIGFPRGINSVSPRLSELKRAGLIVDTGERRRNCAVWRAADGEGDG